MKYDLVFEGGGAKGMVFVGAIQEFEAREHSFDRLLGTSAGAITAALLAAGYTAQEMLEALNERANNQPIFVTFLGTPSGFSQDEIHESVTYKFLKDVNMPLVPEFIEDKLDHWLINALMKQSGYRSLFSFVERGGWFSADKFVEWLQKKLDTGANAGQPRKFSHMTLRDFFDATGTQLSMVAADTSAQRLLVLNHITAPDCPLVWAVRMSMSIPLLWPEVEWQAAWGTYRGIDMTNHLIVDGGILSNFPLELFVSGDPQVTALMGQKQCDNILGLLIDETLPVENAPERSIEDTQFDYNKLRTVKRIRRLINTGTQAHDKMVIEAFEQLVVRLPAQGFGTTEFDMTDERKATLIAAGRKKMGQYFDSLPTVPLDADEDVLRLPDVNRYADKIATRVLQL